MNKQILAGLAKVGCSRLWFVRHDGNTWNFERKVNAIEFITEKFSGEIREKMIKQINSPKWRAMVC